MNVHPEGYCVDHLCKARPCAGSGSIRTLLIAMLDDGYYQALDVRPQALNPLFFPDALEDAKAPIRGQLQFYIKSTTLLRLVRHLHRGVLGKAPH